MDQAWIRLKIEIVMMDLESESVDGGQEGPAVLL